MPLTNMERQRAYRERKKHDLEFKRKESIRCKKYYKPTALLTPSGRKERNQKVRNQVARHRLTNKRETHNVKTVNSSVQKNRAITRKRISKVVSSVRYQLLKTEHKLVLETRRRWAAEKREERRNKVVNNTIMPEKKDAVQEAVCREITYKDLCQDTARSYRISQVVKKYRARRLASEILKVSRNSIVNMCRKAKFRRPNANIRDTVQRYFERDDVSRIFPGKKDFIKVGDEKIQKRMMRDYIKNIYKMFVSENSHIRISYSTFCRLRPRYVLPVKYCSRNVCLCIYHQNFALKLTSMKQLKVVGVDSDNPDDFIKSQDNFTPLIVDATEVSFLEWQRVKTPYTDSDGIQKSRVQMKLVTVVSTVEEFTKQFQLEQEQFVIHARNVKNQYIEQKQLKETLEVGHVLALMDFSENYNCTTLDEIQSAYYGQTQATLHPIVLYWRDRRTGEIVNHSVVIVSDHIKHNAQTVLTFIKSVLPEIKRITGKCDKIYYWTDGPSSQYKNRTIFSIIEGHQELFGIECEWHYCETAHGKGPHDGIGGTLKRLADDSVKHGKSVLQSAEDLMAFFATMEDSKITTLWVPSSDIRSTDLSSHSTTVAIKDTKKVHLYINFPIQNMQTIL